MFRRDAKRNSVEFSQVSRGRERKFVAKSVIPSARINRPVNERYDSRIANFTTRSTIFARVSHIFAREGGKGARRFCAKNVLKKI